MKLNQKSNFDFKIKPNFIFHFLWILSFMDIIYILILRSLDICDMFG